MAKPLPGKEHKGVGILYITDVLGIWQNSQLIADQLAANGYTTVMPDLFNGDALELNINPVYPGNFDLMGWLQNGRNGAGPHTPKEIDPIVLDTIQYMREDLGLGKIGSVGYCFGAKVRAASTWNSISKLLTMYMGAQYVVRHFSDGIAAGFIAHPSFVEEEELAAVSGPLSIAAAEVDPIFPAENRHRSEDLLRSTGNPYQINLYSGVVHGFAVRGDTSKKIEKFAKEQAFLQAIRWFDSWLL